MICHRNVPRGFFVDCRRVRVSFWSQWNAIFATADLLICTVSFKRSRDSQEKVRKGM